MGVGAWGSGIYAILVRLSSPACKGRKDRHNQNNSFNPPVQSNWCTLQIALFIVVETKSQRQCPQNHLLKLLLYEHTVLCPNTTEKSETKRRISWAVNIERFHYHAHLTVWKGMLYWNIRISSLDERVKTDIWKRKLLIGSGTEGGWSNYWLAVEQTEDGQTTDWQWNRRRMVKLLIGSGTDGGWS